MVYLVQGTVINSIFTIIIKVPTIKKYKNCNNNKSICSLRQTLICKYREGIDTKKNNGIFY